MASFDVETINPARNPAYSGRLYEVLAGAGWPEVTAWRTPTGPAIGYVMGPFVHRPKALIFVKVLSRDVVYGPTEFFLNPTLHVRDDALWAEYLRIGVCALFPEHTEDEPEQWATKGDTRACRWCGRLEWRRRWVEVVRREAWEEVPRG